ncbi:MAG: hypothetical protein ACE1ZP_03240, partial [Myxococcota bacterium]
VAALVVGSGTYALTLGGVLDLGPPPIVVSLAASALAMAVGGLLGARESAEMREQIAALHLDGPSSGP